MLIGLISDTHGLLREEALAALGGVDLILHAGDIGGAKILDALGRIAPVRGVHGNCDARESAPAFLDLTLDGIRVHVSHGHELGAPTPAALAARYDADVIVYGHTHKPLIQRVAASLVVNPGAAGPRRFDLRPSVARLTLPSRDVEIVRL